MVRLPPRGAGQPAGGGPRGHGGAEEEELGGAAEEKEQDNAGAVLPHPLTNSGYRLVRSGSDTAPVKIIFSGHFKLEIKPSRIARIDLTSL